MGIFERYLSVWVGLSIVLGVILGLWQPNIFQLIAELEVAHVNIVVAVFIWVMIYPMMVQIDFSSIKNVGKNPKGLVLTICINWFVKPFTMAALGWLFFNYLFADLVDPKSAQEYIAGMILLGVAPCTAMVFVWSQLTKGDPNYTLVQVSVNDVIMIFAFAPISAFLLGVSDIQVPWETLLISVLLYVLLPLIAGVATRRMLNKSSNNVDAPKSADAGINFDEETNAQSDTDSANKSLSNLLATLKPWSVIGLLATVVLLFGFQANTIISEPETIGLIAIPLMIQTYGIFIIAYVAAKWMKLPHNIAAPACLIGTSNFFELAVAVAISLFGLHSGAALATVVGVLVEVPVMLSLVFFINHTQNWFTESE
jgi:ACR3 family arsenite transporter